ncbi:MAG: bifunctional phosphoribosylaminoimidazolecarboxamide formyltransferase/IMP cyclohydrolase [Flavobacteriaceae bacterium]|nr:bifunctional phosphoribosylaminoimidazolecarboxamide formyltransferase/IMP cyclohydrolase [Flavobacteriaceae bacterium]
MQDAIQAKSALISVYNKEGLAPIVTKMHELGITLYSTGGTAAFIKDQNIPVKHVEDLTSYPSILGGRVKTLHPKVFGGILNRRSNKTDQEELTQFEIPHLDIVLVDLYPFEDTVRSGADEAAIIEKIDIGGISLIRAAAKNYNDVLCIASVDDYADFLSLLIEKDGSSSRADRKKFARNAFHISSHYDTQIFSFFNDDTEVLKLSYNSSTSLRYGENPHQKGQFFGEFNDVFTKHWGKELSYNNLLDVDAAVQLMGEFINDAPTFAILKHNNACGIATRDTLSEAYAAALAGDPVSAFGGVLIANKPIDLATAELIHSLFCEVVIAPSYDQDAIAVLKQKKNRILLELKLYPQPETLVRSCLNGHLVQDVDRITDNADLLTDVSNRKVTSTEKNDLLFASKIAKHTKSNTIVLAKNGQLIASGTGQTSRVDALQQAIEKAQNFGFDLEGSVMASDAFFPFPDCVEIAYTAGVRAVIQPGGSIKDQLSIDYCNANNMAMVTTGVRHFKH